MSMNWAGPRTTIMLSFSRLLHLHRTLRPEKRFSVRGAWDIGASVRVDTYQVHELRYTLRIQRRCENDVSLDSHDALLELGRVWSPMTLAAFTICRMNSSRRRMTRMIDPSKSLPPP